MNFVDFSAYRLCCIHYNGNRTNQMYNSSTDLKNLTNTKMLYENKIRTIITNKRRSIQHTKNKPTSANCHFKHNFLVVNPNITQYPLIRKGSIILILLDFNFDNYRLDLCNLVKN